MSKKPARAAASDDITSSGEPELAPSPATAPTDAPAPTSSEPRPNDGLAAIRESLAAQAQVQTRFDPARYRRKQYDAAGNLLPTTRPDR